MRQPHDETRAPRRPGSPTGSTRLGGVIVPMLTPLTPDGSDLAVDAIPWLVEFLIGGGVHALFLAGTTSEGPLLTASERQRLLRHTLDAVDGRVPVVMHVGAAATREAAELAAYSVDAGASAIAAVTPYYYAYDRAALGAYYRQIAAAAPELPLYLYTIPARAGHHLDADLVSELAQVPNIVGIKDSTGDMQRLLAYLELPDVTVLSGSDVLAGAALAAGAHGIVSGLAGVAPQPFVELWNAHREGDAARMLSAYRRVMQVATALKHGTQLALLKALASERIAAVDTLSPAGSRRASPFLGPARSPLCAAPESTVTEARAALAAVAERGSTP